MIEKCVKATDAAWAAYDPQMKSDRHHAQRIAAFCMERVKRVAAIARKVIAEDKAPIVIKAHVIGVERIGKNYVSSSCSRYRVWDIIIISVRVVQKATVLEQQLTRIHRCGRTGMPTYWRHPGRIMDGVHRAC